MTAPPSRPMLLPSARPLWRDAETLQLGSGPEGQVVLDGLPPRGAEFFHLLDGRRTETDIVEAACGVGLTPEEASGVLAELRRRGILLDGDPIGDLPPGLPSPGRRRVAAEFGAVRLTAGGSAHDRPGVVVASRTRASVVVRGSGRIAVPLAALLAAAGVGRVHVDTTGTVTAAEVAVGGYRAGDTRRPRATAAAEAVRAVAPETSTGPPRPGAPPDFLVLATTGRPPVVEALTADVRRVPHLALTLRGDVPVVGPLVVPGRTACLHCVYLHRCDRDPAWPALAAQLATAPGERHCAAALAAVAAGVAALQVLTQLDGGEPDALSASLEIGTSGGLVRRRTWTPHPRCGCIRRALADVG